MPSLSPLTAHPPCLGAPVPQALLGNPPPASPASPQTRTRLEMNGKKKKTFSLSLHFPDRPLLPAQKKSTPCQRWTQDKKTCRTSAEGRDKNSQKPGLGPRPNKRRCVAECTARDTCVSRCPIPCLWSGWACRFGRRTHPPIPANCCSSHEQWRSSTGPGWG